MSQEERGVRVRGYRIVADWAAIRGALFLAAGSALVSAVAYWTAGRAGYESSRSGIWGVLFQTMWGLIGMLAVLIVVLIVLLGAIIVVETFLDVEAVNDG